MDRLSPILPPGPAVHYLYYNHVNIACGQIKANILIYRLYLAVHWLQPIK